MPFAPDWQSIVNMFFLSEYLEHSFPDFSTTLGIQESIGISNYDQAIACPGQHHINAFRRSHEPDLASWIASCEGDNDNVAFFALIVVYKFFYECMEEQS